MNGEREREWNGNSRANYQNQQENKKNYFTIQEEKTIIIMNGSNRSKGVVGSGGGYSDVPSTSSLDLEDGGGGDGDDEGVIEAENPGLMRRHRSTTDRRGNNNTSYESIPTNNGNNHVLYYPPASRLSSCAFGCASVLCQTVVIVTAMMLIGTTGFLIGSAKPDLLIATVNATTGYDLADYLAKYGSTGSVSIIESVDVDIDTATTTAPSSSSISCDEILQDKNENDTAVDDIVEKKKTKVTVRYNPSIVLANSIIHNDDNDTALNNPFNNPPVNNNLFPATSTSTTTTSSPVGYIRRPHLVDNRLVFLAEGDAYVTRLDLDTSMPASKVTTTIGNVLDPKLHPTLPFLAYTATYAGRRDVYLMDLSASKKSSSPIRLTYWDVGAAGVNGVVGWISTNGSKHANAIVFRAMSNDSSLPDYRLYIIHLETTTKTTTDGMDIDNYHYNSVLEIEPLPLAQAMDAARFQKCWYFVRVTQSSHTIRYVGGTAENLWMYCDDDNNNENTTTSTSALSSASSSQPLFSDDGYKGTSKSPQLHHHDGGGDGSNNHSHYLFFLSDRGKNTKEKDSKWIPDRMNVWAIRLNDEEEANQDSISMSYSTNDLIQITDTSCDFEGRTIQEYSIDSSTGNLVVRIGADLYFMSNADIRSKIQNHNSDVRRNNRRSLEQQQQQEEEKEEKEEEKQENTNIDDDIRDGENSNGNGNDNVNVNDDEEKEDDNDINKTSSINNNTNSLADELSSSEIDANDETTTTTTSTDNVATEVASTDTIATTTTTTTTSDEENTVNGGEEEEEEEIVITIIADDNKFPQNVIPDVAPEIVPEVEVVPEVIPDPSEDFVGANNTNNVTDGNDPNKGPTTTAVTVSGLSLEKDDNTESNITSIDNSTDPPAKYYYDFQSPELVSRSTGNVVSDKNSNQDNDHYSGHSTELKRLPIEIYSDFQSEQERIIPVDILKHFKYADVFETITGSTQMLLTLRGQVWVASTAHDALPSYEDTGKNLPVRRYRLAPGSTMGSVTRVLAAVHVPNPVEDDISDRRLAVILATDPLTVTAEHAFYLIETQPGASPLFVDMDRLPKPFLGGIVSGGSTKDGGLGSVKADTLAMSPCGNRMAWSDTDGRIVVMNLPQYQELDNGDGGDDNESSTLKQSTAKFVVLPQKNELDESMVGDEVEMVFSPGGRYLSIQHNAQNQFTVISIADLGDPLGEENRIADIVIGRIVQATPSRFNSVKAYWGKTPTDIHNIAQNKTMAKLFSIDEPDDVPATTIYFLSDRDIKTDVTSPWGTRQKMPHFVTTYGVYAIPFQAKDIEPKDSQRGQFRGGGLEELHVDTLLERMALIQSLLDEKETPTERREKRKLAKTLHPLAGAFGFAEKAFKNQKRRRRQLDGDNIGNEDDDDKIDTVDHLEEAVFPKDIDIDFGPVDLNFARTAYRLSTIPEGAYNDIICQNPDGSLILVKDTNTVHFFVTDGYPSDQYEDKTFNAQTRTLSSWGLSASRKYFYLIYSPDGAIRVVPNTNQGRTDLLADDELDEMVVDKEGMHLSIWPSLEYRQMYDDAWRMLRDYFYDQDMTGIDWPEIHKRFLPLVERCTKREELDDVLIQMASELSALHVFVYNGEYSLPITDDDLKYANEVGSLGATLKRTPAWKGYTVMNIPEADPDFTKIDHSSMIYSPLSDQSLRLSGQRGLQVGDVIVGVNGESVMAVPDIHMLLRGTSGRSIRLEVLRLASGTATTDDTGGIKTSEMNDEEAAVESLITVPISPSSNSALLYSAWEWKTRQMADEMAAKAGISVGYVHLRSMSGAEAEDEFARGFFPNYKKQGFILDVRHNRGGSIDVWVLDVLQRKSWSYWQSRDFNATDGGLDWDMHFAFRGHVIVLLDEKTSSDGEGVSRGIKELGLGKLIGTRTWGGGIWLASDNHLVDGGIATAPEIGTYNEHFGWGLGIEQMGVDPDIVIDNDPHETFTGKDQQLERAIEELKKWIEKEPIVVPKPKSKKKDMTMGDRECKA